MQMQISSKLVVQACNDFEILMHKRRTNKFQVSNYSVYMLVSVVKLSQTFIWQQVQEIFTTNF